MRSIFTRVAAIACVALLGTAVAAPALACGDKHATPAKAVPADATKVTLAVTGMTCGDCANSIRNALVGVSGVYEATVDFDKGEAVVHFDAKATNADALAKAIEKAGYKASKKA